MAEHLTAKRFERFRHIQYLDRKVAEAVARGGARLVISMPPRHGKSWLSSYYTPVWFLSLWPERNVILTSYEATFAATWGRNVRNFLQEHGPSLGVCLADDSQAADRWNTREGGGMITAGIGGPITGRGGHLIIIDDPVKNAEEAMSETIQQRNIEWFNSTLYTRAEPGASIIILMTRWHERDLAGYLLDEHDDAWEEIRLPAIAEDGDPLGRAVGQALCPERYDVAMLEKIKAAVGSRLWAGLYQQRPVAAEGNIIQREWIKHYDIAPSDFDEKAIFADLSFKGGPTSDFTVAECWARKDTQIFLLDQIRGRMSFPEQVRAIRNMRERHTDAFRIQIEDAANSAAVIETLQQEIMGLIAVKPHTSKEARLAAVSSFYEAGNVFYPNPDRLNWVQTNIDEIMRFPTGKNDDTVDCASQAVFYLGSIGNSIRRLEALSRW
jgi:predicted phage terminase large subunit-like protein